LDIHLLSIPSGSISAYEHKRLGGTEMTGAALPPSLQAQDFPDKRHPEAHHNDYTYLQGQRAFHHIGH
jgi:hypothetical protein